MRTAAIGIGSNSLRMLIADISNGKLHRLSRYREGLRVFAALDGQGNIGEEMIRKTCQSVASFATEARRQNAEQLHLFATSAVRDARNQKELASALEQATGLRLVICDGALEALLSFIGATDGEKAGLIDIGGGSTEIAAGSGTQIEASTSLQMGAVRLFKRYPITSVGEAWAVTAEAEKLLDSCKSRFLALRPERWVGVGGTFTTTAALVQRIPWDRREHIHGYRLSRENVRIAMERLAPMPLEQRLQLPCLQPQRADIVVHGMAILLACMNALEIPSILVSEYGNLEGYLKMKYLYPHVYPA